MKELPTVTVGIPAYNEENNIRTVLESILKQKSNSYNLQEIIVISDGSNDKTVENARSIKDKRIKVLDDKNRKGKSQRLNEIFSANKSNYLVLCDADTRVKEDAISKLIAPLVRDSSIGLAGGNPSPNKSDNFSSNTVAVGVYVTQAIRNEWHGGNNVYCFNGRLLALSKELCKKIHMKSTPGNDAFIYFSTKKFGYTPIYVKEAVSYFELPENIADHDKQSVRFTQSILNMHHYFGDIVNQEYRVSKVLELKILFGLLLRMPLETINYIKNQAVLKYMHKNKIFFAKNDLWKVSESTKNLQVDQKDFLIEYVVPELNHRGGIQTLAKSIFEEVKKDNNVIISNYNYLPFLIRALLLVLPDFLGLFIYLSIIAPTYRRIHPLKGSLIHFWYADCCGSYLDKNFIVSFHGRELLAPNLKGYKRILYQKIMDRALHIHADTNYIKNILIKDFNIKSDKITVIYPTSTIPEIIKKTKVHSIFTIGSLSRFNKRKNILGVIEALILLKNKYKVDFKYYLAGTGIQKEEIIEKLKNSGIDYTYFANISDSDKFNSFFPSLDVFVLPTLNYKDDVEGFGLVYLEANAFGVPVVASKVGGVGEAVKEYYSGLFAKPEDADDIAKKIMEVKNEGEEMKKTSSLWIKQFDIKVISNKFTILYRKLYK